MQIDEKIISFAVKLNRLTSIHKLNWKIKEPPPSITRGTNSIINAYYETKYKDNYPAIYLERYQSYEPDFDTHLWGETIVLVLLDKDKRVLLESTKRSPAINDLFATIREHTSGIDDLLNELDDLDKDDE